MLFGIIVGEEKKALSSDGYDQADLNVLGFSLITNTFKIMNLFLKSVVRLPKFPLCI